MKGAAILIHYHTPDLVAPALEALRQDAEQNGLEMDWILVDNGSEEADRVAWQSLPLEVLVPGKNLGYAGGVNLGVRHTNADWFVLMNPDVFVRPGCLAALRQALLREADAAGPRFFWDQGQHWHLPPTERRRRLDELFAVLARHGELWASFARRRWRRHARKHWLAEQPMRSFELSGALLAIRRDAWERIGPFDEAYRLYFEETDWLERLRRSRGRSEFVPQAEAIHLHAQSTIAEARSEGWFLDSARRFRRRHYGDRFNLLLEAVDRWGSDRKVVRRQPVQTSPKAGLEAAWIEASASPAGFPAAARRLSKKFDVDAVLQSLPAEIIGQGVQLRSISGDGRELSAWRPQLSGDGRGVASRTV